MASPPPFDPYEVLGVTKDAGENEIKKAHRKLVITCHPDKIHDATPDSMRVKLGDQFHKVQRSYEILVDPSERKRYDNQMRLAELKAEQYGRGGGYGSARPTGGPSSYEYRNGQRYEEVVPTDLPRFFEEDARFFDEPQPRASARKYDGYDRRSSDGRTTEKKPKAKVVEVKVGGFFTKGRAHDREESYSKREKNRERDRRQEASTKNSRSAYVQDESEESDVDSYFSSRREPEPEIKPRRRYEEPPKKSKAEPSRRKETRRNRDDDYSDEWEYRHVADARDYIQRSKGTTPIEADTRRPANGRTSSSRYYEAEPEEVRRSSEKSRPNIVKEALRTNSSGRERRPSIEIIEPSPKHTRKPSIPTSKSSPQTLKGMLSPRSREAPPVTRSATTQYGHDNRRETPSLRRADTTPTATPRHNDNMPSKSSKLRYGETHDSGYSSPGTPEMYQSSSPPKSTKYQIVEPVDEDYSRGHRTVLLEPEFSHSRRATRSPSPPPRRSDRPERPTLSTRGSSRPTPSRSNTSYAVSPDITPRPSIPRHESSRGASRGTPPMSRHGSGRDNKHLFGEDFHEVNDAYKTRYSDDQVRYAKNYGPDDVNYGRYDNGRRGSSGGTGTDRDTYPGSHYGDPRPANLQRGATFAF